jgi:hypothetical protein
LGAAAATAGLNTSEAAVAGAMFVTESCFNKAPVSSLEFERRRTQYGSHTGNDGLEVHYVEAGSLCAGHSDNSRGDCDAWGSAGDRLSR